MTTTKFSSYIYIASPYSHPDPEVMSRRYRDVMRYTASMLQRQEWCYSPIVHCHEMARYHYLPTDAAYWKDYNETMMRNAHGLHVLRLPGWERSLGVSAEIAFWKKISTEPIHYID